MNDYGKHNLVTRKIIIIPHSINVFQKNKRGLV